VSKAYIEYTGLLAKLQIMPVWGQSIWPNLAEKGMFNLRNKFGLRIAKSITSCFNYKIFGARQVMARGILRRPEIKNASLYYLVGWLSVIVLAMYLGDTSMATWIWRLIFFQAFL
jgi:hypothetical protein